MTLAAATDTARGAHVLSGLDGVSDVTALGPGGLACGRVAACDLVAAACALKNDHGFDHLELLTAMEARERGSGAANVASGGAAAGTAVAPAAADSASDEASGPASTGVDVVYAFTRRSDRTTVVLVVELEDAVAAAASDTRDAHDSGLRVPTLSAIWPGANPLEREVYDLFGVVFEGHPVLRRLVLRDDFEGHPLRKSYPMGEHGVSAEKVAASVASHGTFGPEGDATAGVPGFDFIGAARGGDEILHSERLVLNVGPQHPSTHGVLHLWLVLEGESIVAAQPTHGYLHRCIEKLCESRTYKACNALMDRCDYVSGFHTELAYTLALEELLGVESTPKADYLRVLMSELVRITSHHTWYTAAGFDTGALTPFLYAFIDREKILDFFETVTGARMMFNYIRPGGVKDEIQPHAAGELRRFLKHFGDSVDEYEALLTGNEIFRARMRGVGFLSAEDVRAWGVTGPMARGSGVDIDLRRDAPYAAYGDFDVRVPLGETGDTFDRYLVRIEEMRESARLALAALDGMPEGPHMAEGVPRILRPPAGTAYRSVESSRGELGVLLASDGSDTPWRLKVRSPALSNVHAAPCMLAGCRVGDVIPVVGSVDVVMGEIDR